MAGQLGGVRSQLLGTGRIGRVAQRPLFTRSRPWRRGQWSGNVRCVESSAWEERPLPFGMHVLYTVRNPRPEFERETGAVRVDLTRLLRESDVLSLHAPSVAETKGIVHAGTLAQMKRSAVLINTARGDLIREEPLATGLEGAARRCWLDVYVEEPHVRPVSRGRRAPCCCRTSGALPEKRARR